MDKKETFHVVSTYRETPTDHHHMKGYQRGNVRDFSCVRLIHYLLESWKKQMNKHRMLGSLKKKKKKPDLIGKHHLAGFFSNCWKPSQLFIYLEVI